LLLSLPIMLIAGWIWCHIWYNKYNWIRERMDRQRIVIRLLTALAIGVGFTMIIFIPIRLFHAGYLIPTSADAFASLSLISAIILIALTGVRIWFYYEITQKKKAKHESMDDKGETK